MYRNKAIIVYAIILMGIIFYYSLSAVWLNDDINYGFSFFDGSTIDSVGDILESQKTHYLTVNGRFPAHFLVQLFIGLWGKFAFAIVNAVAYMFLVLLIIKNSRLKTVKSNMALFAILLTLLGFQTKFVPSCMIGYVWMFSIVLLFLYKFFDKNSKHSFLLIPLSILAGWTNESLVVGISVALFLFVMKNRRSCSRLQWTMFFGFAFGASLLCLAPSNIARTHAEVASVDFLSPCMYSLVKFLFYTKVLYILFFVIVYLKIKNKISIRTFYKENDFWVHSIFVLLAFNLVIGVFGNRQLFGIELISIILLLNLANRYINHYVIYINNILLLIYFSILGFNVHYLNQINQKYDAIELAYRESDDGIVFMDFNVQDVIFNETYPCENFTIHVIKSMDRLFNYKNDNINKTLKVLPQICQDIETTDSNYYINNGEDAHAVIIDKENQPFLIKQNRNLHLLGIDIPFKQRILRENDIVYEDKGISVYQIYDKIPIIKGDTFVFDYK